MAFGLSALLLAFPWFRALPDNPPQSSSLLYRVVSYLEGLDRRYQLPTTWMKTPQLGYSNL
jgi:hypothetical protein